MHHVCVCVCTLCSHLQVFTCLFHWLFLAACQFLVILYIMALPLFLSSFLLRSLLFL